MFKSDVKVTRSSQGQSSPPKPLSILFGAYALVASVLDFANSIVNALNLPNLRITFWSDSTTALADKGKKGSCKCLSLGGGRTFVVARSPEYWPLGETPGDSEEVELERKIKSVKSMSSEPTPLPPDRVTDCAPFEIVGIDLAGPLFLKDGRKVWITLFTCAVYRAIHLELVNS
ncbi:integrase catalytic domain-containing protein [Trichonephila clavipes]|nr:integrase catalytic domain-containing protein [Trichonephila clavipes]